MGKPVDPNPRQDEDLVLECRPDEAGCTASIGFGGFAEADDPTTDTTDAIARLRHAWKATLAREGKLHKPEQTVRRP